MELGNFWEESSEVRPDGFLRFLKFFVKQTISVCCMSWQEGRLKVTGKVTGEQTDPWEFQREITVFPEKSYPSIITEDHTTNTNTAIKSKP